MQSFGVKDSTAKQILVFSFANQLPPDVTLDTTKVPVVTITCLKGNDQSSTAVFNGAAYFDTTKTLVYQPVQGGLPGAIYVIKVNCATTDPKTSPTVVGKLPIGCP